MQLRDGRRLPHHRSAVSVKRAALPAQQKAALTYVTANSLRRCGNGRKVAKIKIAARPSPGRADTAN